MPKPLQPFLPGLFPGVPPSSAMRGCVLKGAEWTDTHMSWRLSSLNFSPLRSSQFGRRPSHAPVLVHSGLPRTKGPLRTAFSFLPTPQTAVGTLFRAREHSHGTPWFASIHSSRGTNIKPSRPKFFPPLSLGPQNEGDQGLSGRPLLRRFLTRFHNQPGLAFGPQF